MKIVVDKSVLEQALEALEAADVAPHSSDAVHKVIDAFLDALAQQEEPVATLTAQRDALLTALRRIAMASEATVCNQEWIAKTARAAIKAVEEIGRME